MIATVPTQAQVDQIARELAPAVVRIRLEVGRDWSEDPAIYFRVILSDEASQQKRLGEASKIIRAKLSDALQLSELDRIPYFWFRSQSEQAKLREAAWE
jgi:hypothetical protein